MSDEEIREELRKYADRIFFMDPKDAYKIKNELDKFCKDNKVTVAQLQEFAESGAGEMLHMLTR